VSAASDIVIVGPAETTDLGVPGLSVLGLHLDAARSALSDAGCIRDGDVDAIIAAATQKGEALFA
jgi:3-oxoacyl-[acyl-carrier-protein] synthase III